MDLNCIIIDDDEMAASMIKHCVERTDFLNLIEVCMSVSKALTVLKENRIDLIFLDVEMPEISGVDFMKTFPNLPQIILVTTSQDYAVAAFDYNVIGYILKPIDYSKFLKATIKAKEINDGLRVNESGNSIFVKKDSQLIKIATKDIIWIEALSDYVNVYTTNNRYTVHSTMKAIENKLNSKEFIRIHRSFIVRIDLIKSIEGHHVAIADKVLPIGANYKEKLFNRLNLL